MWWFWLIFLRILGGSFYDTFDSSSSSNDVESFDISFKYINAHDVLWVSSCSSSYSSDSIDEEQIRSMDGSMSASHLNKLARLMEPEDYCNLLQELWIKTVQRNDVGYAKILHYHPPQLDDAFVSALSLSTNQDLIEAAIWSHFNPRKQFGKQLYKLGQVIIHNGRMNSDLLLTLLNCGRHPSAYGIKFIERLILAGIRATNIQEYNNLITLTADQVYLRRDQRKVVTQTLDADDINAFKSTIENADAVFHSNLLLRAAKQRSFKCLEYLCENIDVSVFPMKMLELMDFWPEHLQTSILDILIRRIKIIPWYIACFKMEYSGKRLVNHLVKTNHQPFDYEISPLLSWVIQQIDPSMIQDLFQMFKDSIRSNYSADIIILLITHRYIDILNELMEIVQPIATVGRMLTVIGSLWNQISSHDWSIIPQSIQYKLIMFIDPDIYLTIKETLGTDVPIEHDQFSGILSWMKSYRVSLKNRAYGKLQAQALYQLDEGRRLYEFVKQSWLNPFRLRLTYSLPDKRDADLHLIRLKLERIRYFDGLLLLYLHFRDDSEGIRDILQLVLIKIWQIEHQQCKT